MAEVVTGEGIVAALTKMHAVQSLDHTNDRSVICGTHGMRRIVGTH